MKYSTRLLKLVAIRRHVLNQIPENTKPNKIWNRIDRTFTYLTTAFAIILSVIVFRQHDEIEALKEIASIDTTTMRNTEKMLDKMMLQNQKLDEEIIELMLQNTSINKGLIISTAQLKEMNLQTSRTDTTLTYARRNDIYDLWLTNDFIKYHFEEFFYGKGARPYFSKAKLIDFANDIDSALSSQLKNNFLNATLLRSEWYISRTQIRQGLRALTSPDYSYLLGTSGEKESTFLEEIFEKNESQIPNLNKHIDSLLLITKQ